MARESHQRGPQTKRYERRFGFPAEDLGVTVDSPGGIAPDSPGTDLEPHQFTYLQNARWDATFVRPRGGMRKATPQFKVGQVPAWVHPHQLYDGAPWRCFVVGGGCPQIDPAGSYLGWFDDNALPAVQRGVWYDGASYNMVAVPWGGLIWIGVDSTLRVMNIPAMPLGFEALGQSGFNTDILVHDFGATDWAINGLIPFDSKLFILLRDISGGGAHAIWAYDGAAVLEDEAPFVAQPVAACVLNERLFVGFDNGDVRIRTLGAVPGTWALVGNTGFGIRPGLNSMVGGLDRIYISVAKNSNTIYSATTSAVALARTLPLANDYCMALAWWPGRGMFYPYHRESDKRVTMGFFDPRAATWTDAYNQLTAVNGFPASEVRGATVYRNRLTLFGFPQANFAFFENGAETGAAQRPYTSAVDWNVDYIFTG
jgi:hypothetical protein